MHKRPALGRARAFQLSLGRNTDTSMSYDDSSPAIKRDHAANAGRHRLRDRRDDLYETPPEAVQALLRVERLPHRIWEPCCGPGSIVRVLRDAGHDVVATDLVDRGCSDSTSRIDFLMERRAPAGVEAIVTNPPFKLAAEFIEHGLELVPQVVMLLRLAFLESERRSPILDDGRLARIYVFRNRLPMMHRDSWNGPLASSSIPFAWFVWSGGHQGPATINRISWRPFEYDAQQDITESVRLGFEVIRARVRSGGRGWSGA
jgi:hypothetical protein